MTDAPHAEMPRHNPYLIAAGIVGWTLGSIGLILFVGDEQTDTARLWGLVLVVFGSVVVAAWFAAAAITWLHLRTTAVLAEAMRAAAASASVSQADVAPSDD